MDGGGHYVSSTHYGMDGSVHAFAGLSSNAIPIETALHGYVGQLYEVTQLLLAATPSTLTPAGTSQLSGTAALDDATYLALSGADVLWAAPSPPIVSLSLAGLATAGTPLANTLASLNGSFLGASAAVTLAVVVHPPVSPDLSLTTRTNTSLTLSVAKLLALASSPDGYALSLTTVTQPTTPGGSVGLGTPTLTYTPATGFGGIDQFTYTLDDSHGGTVTVTVTITVGTPTGVSLNIVFGPVISDGQFVIRFAGVPGSSYTVERADVLGGPWTKVTNLTAPSDNVAGFGIGVFEFSEPTGGVGARFYRTVNPAY